MESNPFVFDSEMRLFIPDVLVIIFLGVSYLLLEFVTPFHRLFFLDDNSIKYPHAEHESVPISMCILLSVLVPAICIVFLPAILPRRRNYNNSSQVRFIYVSLLGLGLTFVANGFITNITKVWLGRMRPDFLARCIPKLDTPINIPVGIEVCTNKSLHVINEGFKSTPSGHSSTSFSGLLYLSLWISGQLGSFRTSSDSYKSLFSLSPLLIALYIAISRTQDYRHHYFDVICGSLLGSVVGWACYRKYFPHVSSVKSYEPYSVGLESSPQSQGYLGTYDNGSETASTLV